MAIQTLNAWKNAEKSRTGRRRQYHQCRVVPPAQRCTTSVGVDLESNCLYLQRRELMYQATVCTSSVGSWFTKQLFVPPA